MLWNFSPELTGIILMDNGTMSQLQSSQTGPSHNNTTTDEIAVFESSINKAFFQQLSVMSVWSLETRGSNGLFGQQWLCPCSPIMHTIVDRGLQLLRFFQTTIAESYDVAKFLSIEQTPSDCGLSEIKIFNDDFETFSCVMRINCSFSSCV